MSRTTSALIGASVLLVGISTVSAAQHAHGSAPPHAPVAQAPAAQPAPPAATQEHPAPTVNASPHQAGNREHSTMAPAAASQPEREKGSAAHNAHNQAGAATHGTSHSAAHKSGSTPAPHTP